MASTQLLYFKEYNDDRPQTIVFIHGALTTINELDTVASHIPSYHLLLPNLHLNGETPESGERRLSLPDTSDDIASLIRSHAKTSKVHVVGLSMGAHIALDLASRYPEVVDALIVSGVAAVKPSVMGPVFPYGMVGAKMIEDSLPKSLHSRLMDGIDLSNPNSPSASVDLCRQVLDVVFASLQLQNVHARTLVCAATKRNWYLPSGDNVEHAKEVARAINEKDSSGESASKAVEISKWRHPWWVQAPKLFADSVCAWFERRQLPSELEELD